MIKQLEADGADEKVHHLNRLLSRLVRELLEL
jgi:hypothetical protein